MNAAAKLSTNDPPCGHRFPHTLKSMQAIDFKCINGEIELSTPSTATTNLLLKTEQQA
jgi:hypothetical protein